MMIRIYRDAGTMVGEGGQQVQKGKVFPHPLAGVIFPNITLNSFDVNCSTSTELQGALPPPKCKILHGFAPQKNQQSGGLYDKIRLCPSIVHLKTGFATLGMTSRIWG